MITTNGLPLSEGGATAERPRPVATDYIEHASALYAASLHEFTAAPNDPAAAEQWDAANALVCGFAIDTGDADLAKLSYASMRSPVKKWEMVAKRYTAGQYLEAVEWQAPLEDAIVRGEATVFDTLAMYKAKAAMEFHRLKYADGSEATSDIRGGIERIRSGALSLLAEQNGKELAPRGSKYGQQTDHNLDSALDVRSHLLDFAKLYCANGEFDTAAGIMQEIARISATTSQLGNQDQSLSAARDAENFGHTIELRSLTYGLDAATVRERANHWKVSGADPATRLVAQTISQLHARAEMDRGVRGELTARLFIESTYPDIPMRGRNHSIYQPGHTLAVRLKAGDWAGALSHYDDYLSIGGRMLGLADALLMARYGQRIDDSELMLSATATIDSIQSVAKEWGDRLVYTDATARLGLIREANQKLAGLLHGTHYPAAMQQQIFRALLAAKSRLGSDGSDVQGRVRSYVQERLYRLSQIPDAENTIPSQLAELRALAADAGISLQ